MKLGIIYLYYPDGPRYNKEKPIQALKKIISHLGCKTYTVYINNASKEEFTKKISENEFEISGDNSFFEFSGWQKGVNFIKNNHFSCDTFLFVNDMFLHDSLGDRGLVNLRALKCGLTHQAMVGRKMYFPVTGKIMGNDVIPYVRTHIFMVPQEVLSSLGSLLSIDSSSIERFFIPNYDASIPLFRKEAPLSKKLQEFIFFYVTSKWNRKKPYTPENFEILKYKAISILNALLLSIRVRQLGYPLIPYTKTRLLSSRSLSIDAINRLWHHHTNGHLKDPSTLSDRFWLNNILFYRHLPKEIHFLRKYSSPDHL